VTSVAQEQKFGILFGQTRKKADSFPGLYRNPTWNADDNQYSGGEWRMLVCAVSASWR